MSRTECVVDVGAHIGDTSIWMWKCLGDNRYNDEYTFVYAVAIISIWDVID